MWQRRFTPSKHIASKRPLPSILVTFNKIVWKLSTATTMQNYIEPGRIPDHPPWTRALFWAPRSHSFPSSCSFLPFPCSWALFSSLSLSQDHRKSPKPLPPLIVGAGLNCGLGVASNNLHSVYFSKLTVLAEFDLKVQKVSLIYIELGLALMITSLSMKVHTLSQKR